MNLSEQSVLADVAKNELKTDIRRKAVKKLTDQTALAYVAEHDSKMDIRIIALKRLSDQSAIGEVAKNDRKTDIRKMALKKLTDPAAVFEVAKNDRSADIRRRAIKRMKKLEKLNGKIIRTTENNAVADVAESNIDIDIFKKIDSAVCEMDFLVGAANEEIISDEIIAIKEILVKMAAFLREEKDIEQRVRQLGQFFDYYFPTILKIFGSYRQISEHKLDGGNALETKKKIAGSMPVIRKAFEKELDNLYANKMLDIATDIDVLETMLAKDGVLDNQDFILN